MKCGSIPHPGDLDETNANDNCYGSNNMDEDMTAEDQVKVYHWTQTALHVQYWLQAYYGERCKDCESTCITCRKWRLFDELFKDKHQRELMSKQTEPSPTHARIRLSEIKDMRKAVKTIECYGHFTPGQDGFAAMAMLRKFFDVLANENIPYGYCPHCGSLGVSRERRPDGNDTCGNGHVYPSHAAR